MSHLSGGRLNVALLQNMLKSELLYILQDFDGPKAMIWDKWLEGPIGLIAKYSLLQEHDVVQMHELQGNSPIPHNVKHVIFIIRPKVKLIELIAEYVLKASENNQHKREFHVLFVPKKSELCDKYLKNMGVFGSFTTIEEFKCDMYPFDNDLMSLEFENDFRDHYLDGDPTSLYYSAVAIRRIEKLYGTIPKVFCVGQSSKQVWNLVSRLNKEEQNILKIPTQGVVDELILIDRSIDLSSVLCTQLTYEGLIDELFGINSTTARLPGKKFLNVNEQAQSSSTEKKKIILNSSEEVFAVLRDKSFTYVGGALARKARLMHEHMLETRKNKSIQEIKEFVSKLPEMLANKQSLANHTAIAEYIKEITDTIDFHDILQCEEDFLDCFNTSIQSTFIEDLIAQKAPLTRVLRLISLQCVTSSGLKPKILEHYKREIVHVYGLNPWLGLCNLEKANILKPQTNSRQYTILRKALQLIGDDNKSRKDSYLDRTYTPITVRLVEILSKNKPPYVTGLQDISNIIPGLVTEETQSVPQGQQNKTETTKVVLVFFIGGCTYSEISALRTLSQQADSNVDYVIMTTKLINGNTFIESLLEPTP